MSGIGVYKHSKQFAAQHGETELFLESFKANKLCARDIEEAVRACEYGDGSHDFKYAIDALAAQYGPERVSLVLVCEVMRDAEHILYPVELHAWAQGCCSGEYHVNPEFGGGLGVRTSPGILSELIIELLKEDIISMDKTQTSQTVSYAEGRKETDKRLIRFIDSGHRELFQIPDGGSIRIVYPPGDGRGIVERICKHLDDYHFDLRSSENSHGSTYHICEFAERMEAIGARYEPLAQLRGLEIMPYTPGEDKFYLPNREDGNTCAGILMGSFGRDGSRYNSSWNHRENDGYTNEMQSELQKVVYELRRDLLKDHDSMLAYCVAHPEAKLPECGEYAIYGFKLEAESRQYFVRCFAEHDSRFAVYAYSDKPTVPINRHQSA
jgi:hypothetical protein